MTRVARLSLMAALTLAGAGVIPALAAAPAQADTDSCISVLEDGDVDVTPQHVAACRLGEQGDYQGCVRRLYELDGASPLADIACESARG